MIGVKIIAVRGEEPTGDGEASTYIVGQSAGEGYDTVTRIEHRVENRGDHGIGWFDVYTKDFRMRAAEERLAIAINERHTAEVSYITPEPIKIVTDEIREP